MTSDLLCCLTWTAGVPRTTRLNWLITSYKKVLNSFTVLDGWIYELVVWQVSLTTATVWSYQCILSHKSRLHVFVVTSGISAALWEANLCWRCVVHSFVGRLGLGFLLESPVCVHIEADNYQTRSRQQQHKSCIDFLTAGRLQGMVPLPAHPAHSDLFSSLPRGRTTCSITRRETDFFQLQWTEHKPRLTTSSAQTEQREDGWAGTEDKGGRRRHRAHQIKLFFTSHLKERERERNKTKKLHLKLICPVSSSQLRLTFGSSGPLSQFGNFFPPCLVYDLCSRSSQRQPPPLRVQRITALKAQRAVNVMGQGWLFLTSNKTHRPSPQISPPGGGGVRGSRPRRHMEMTACLRIAWACMWL